MYDYIIVGAGSAGCVLAAQLTEDPGTRVLLLEAGPPDDAPEIRIPALAPTLWTGRFAWDNATVPQRHAANRGIQWPSGRTLGGSSSINAMVYVRGNRLDYDTWRDAYGCDGWGYADLLPYFRQAEDQARGESVFHGTGGPLRVEDGRYRHVLNQAWLESARVFGLPANDDFNGAEQAGVGEFQVTQRRGERWSTADAYLRPALDRANLTVETGALVTKVLLENGRAAGVRYVGARDGVERDARAQAEVVLAGGALNSPTLLMRSGIGPAQQLRDHGIDVVVDAPRVGEGLQDHPACAPRWRTPRLRGHAEEATPENMALWRETRQGPMASAFGPEAGGFGFSREGLPAPDLAYFMSALPGPDEMQADRDRRVVSLYVVTVAVKSRGRVTLRSADPRAKPVVDPAYFSAEADLAAMVAGIRQQREIAARAPLAAHLAGEVAPGDAVSDDEQLRAWARQTVSTLFHPTSTCAMGGAGDAVCDPQLRVRGIDGLRVADASVMPAVPRGNTNAPTIALAERAADLIKGVTPLAPMEQARQLEFLPAG